MRTLKNSKWKATAGLGLATVLVAGTAAADLRRAGEPYELELPAYKDPYSSNPTDAYPFWSDVSNLAQAFEAACPDISGETKFLRIVRADTDSGVFAALVGRPEVLSNGCPVAQLPEHVTEIRLEALCGGEPTVLTTFDGTTLDVEFEFVQVPVLVGADFVLPPNCNRVAQRLVIAVDPPGAESVHLPHSP